ncbi:hypothetical protein [Pandoraea anhela]|uniref:hypothetical protein n=1 Tax=Pandoraea anhela TaxID=2508295 RepID=UPI0012417D12|nr:hypothetical protein [Pandoraea anhela]
MDDAATAAARRPVQVFGADELSLALLPKTLVSRPRRENQPLKIHVDVVVVAKLERVGLPVIEAAFLDSTGGL